MLAVLDLILEIRATLKHLSADNPAAREVLDALVALELTPENLFGWQPAPPAHTDSLDKAIADMPSSLAAIAGAISKAQGQLQWRVDRGLYYDARADVGEAYLNGNMHCELIGPSGSAIHSDDLTLGLFLLAPRLLYRDHRHMAPELYLTLSEPSGWRFGAGSWHDLPAGCIIWNAPNEIHATRVSAQPFLSVYSWTRDVRAKCRVVHNPDWSEIEERLAAE